MSTEPRQPPPAHARRCLRPPATAAAAFAFCVAMLGTTVPTPLFGLYEQDFGFTPLVVTVVFAAYALAVVAALLAFGRASDEVGRRPVLVAGLVLSGAAAIVFLLADDVAALLVGRVLSGISAGLFTSAGTATLLDLAEPERRAQAAALAIAANIGGLALGTLGSGLLASVAGEPLRLPWAVDLGLVVLALAGLATVPETVAVPAGRRLPAPRLPHVPAEVRGIFVPAALAGGSGFAVTGLLTSISALFIAEDLHLHHIWLFGLPAALAFAATTAGQLQVRKVPERVALPAGSAGMLLAVALVATALATSTLAPLLVGALVLGGAMGLSVGAGLAALAQRAPPARRAETASAFFVALYTFLALPVIGVGMLVELTDLRTGGLIFSAAIALLLAGVLARQLRDRDLLAD